MGTLLILSKLTTRPSLSIIGGWSTKLELSKLYSFPSLLRKFGNCDGKTSSFPYKSTIPRGEATSLNITLCDEDEEPLSVYGGRW